MDILLKPPQPFIGLFLYLQPDCDFTKLLCAAMTCENKAASRASIKAKSLQVSVEDGEQVANSGISSIREQLNQMSAILKGANFKLNNGFKSQKNDKSDVRSNLKGLGYPLRDLSGRVKGQFNVTAVTGGDIISSNV